MINTYKRLRESGEKGFTLIELMIVMVVLGILAGIVIFAVGAFDDSANTATDEANDKICQTAIAAAAATPASDTYKTFLDDQTLTCP